MDRALEEAGIDRSEAYVTNAVKHFKWRPRGKRRLHQTPRAGEIEACKPWLQAEVEAVEPQAVLAMGATAARALFGPQVKVTKDRGRPLESRSSLTSRRLLRRCRAPGGERGRHRAAPRPTAPRRLRGSGDQAPPPRARVLDRYRDGATIQQPSSSNGRMTAKQRLRIEREVLDLVS